MRLVVTTRVATYVAALPFPCHAQQIVGIHDAEITVHEVYDEIVHGRKAQHFMPVLLEKFCAPTHYRPHFSVAQHAFPYVGRRRVETIVKTWVGGDCLDQCFREKRIMDGVLGGASNGRGALHHVGVSYRPLIGLLCAHGAAYNERETFQVKFFRDKFVLRAHVIPDAHMGKISHPGRWRRVVRRGGKTIADLINDDDEILAGIEGVALADIYLLHDLVCAGVPGGNEDGIVFRSIELAESSVGELAGAYRVAFLQIDITDVV